MSLFSNRWISSPLQWTLLAGFIGLSACSSKNKDVSENRQNDDTSVGTLSDSNNTPSQNSQTEQHLQAYRKSVRPAVLSVPVIKEAHWLNAYYFVTAESETWETLSIKFYNTTDKATLLQRWNDGQTLKVGSPVYYNSPFRPTDRDKVLSFADDFGQAPLEHKVQAGDTLSKMAVTLWGNAQAWPAIAAANPNITHPDVIHVGDTVWLPPTVDSKGILASLTTPMPEIKKAEVAVQTLPKKVEPAPASTIDTVKPSTPMRTSSLIVFAGIILVLSAGVYILWKRSLKDEPVLVYHDASEQIGEPTNPGSMTNLDSRHRSNPNA